MARFCVKCGSPIKEGSNFCVSCGHAVGANAVEQKAPVSNVGQEPHNKNELLSELNQEQQYFAERAADYDEIIRLSRMKSEAQRPRTGGSIIGIGVTIAIGSFIFIILGLEIAVFGLGAGILIALFGIIRAAGGDKQIVAYEVRQQELQARVNDIEGSLRKYHAGYENSQVAYEYSDPNVLQTLINIIQVGRADSTKEAIHCLEMDMHNAEMLRLQKETAESAKKAADSASTAALFSAANYVRGIRK